MPTTSNFGWTTPADTDLVKDGAAAIRTLGNGIDTSLVDLKGGTTGQILSKTSNTDLDYTWVTPNVGDITEVQAGTGISVASGTGPIPVITNTVATAFDAAGDIVYGTGADTFTKLGIGTAGQVLKVNSGATAPEWGSATPSFVGCDLRKTASQSISSGGAVLVSWDSENFDTDGFHDNSTNNSRITIPTGKGGYYLFYALFRWESNATGQRNTIFYVNGSEGASLFRNIMGGDTNQIYTVTWLLNLNAADYVQVYGNHSAGVSINLEAGTVGQTTSASRFGCVRLG